MSTGYYVRINCCQACGRYTAYKIAHQAAGWRTLLMMVPALNIHDLESLEFAVNTKGSGLVFPEYETDSPIPWETFKAQVQERQIGKSHDYCMALFKDSQGFEFDRSSAVDSYFGVADLS